MVDWASQYRLYSAGYKSVDIRYRRINIDSSLPYSISLNKSNFSHESVTNNFYDFQDTVVVHNQNKFTMKIF
jgi:hypothetical protein